MKPTLLKKEKVIRDIVFQFVDSNKYKVFVFGSMATGKAKKFSDYDIGIISKKPVAWKTLSLAEEAFKESDLLFKVDLVDFSCGNQFVAGF